MELIMDYPIEDKLMLLVAWHTPGKLPAKRKPNLVKNLTLAAVMLAERQARIERLEGNFAALTVKAVKLLDTLTAADQQVATLTEQNAKLMEALENAEKDAARYRWLRPYLCTDDSGEVGVMSDCFVPNDDCICIDGDYEGGILMDLAIDAALTPQPENREGKE